MNHRDSRLRVGVIGAGPGGYACAYRAADLGCAVTLIDRAPTPGGVCSHHGCIPSKALLHVAQIVSDARDAAHMGVTLGSPRIDLGALRHFKERVVEALTQGNAGLARARKVAYVQGGASLLGPTRVHVAAAAGPLELAFDYVVLATGSRPVSIPNCQVSGMRIWDSTSALALPFIPKTLLVIGGGYIGLELATVYAALGSRVTVVEATSQLLAGADRDLVGPLVTRLASMAESVRTDTRIVSADEGASDVRVVLSSGGEETAATFDAVLVAVGRRPNSGVAGLQTAAITLDSAGFIQVDAQRRTSDPRVFAIGDVAGEPMLAHKASHEGIVAAEVIAGERVRFSPRVIPAVVFTDPEIAWCGLTESQALAERRPVRVATFPWAASGRAVTLGAPAGLTKLIVDRETGRVLGAGIVGRGAGELIAEAVLAIEMGAHVAEIAKAIHPHPTLSETLMEAAEAWSGHATHVYRARRIPAA